MSIKGGCSSSSCSTGTDALDNWLTLPAHLGRLPSLIGEPAGGSLTADQWLVFSIVVAPLISLQLWQEYIPEESPQELAQWRAREIAATLEAKQATAAAARQAQPAVQGKRALARGITEVDLTESDRLIREYCQELVELYGPEVICFIHHYATHTARCVRNYGPLHQFWTFLFERLNKAAPSVTVLRCINIILVSAIFREHIK
ncbi:hypothetical protein DFH08DRAFT_819781 [Mycena albidolilacea]|uniref:Uncharacterized protein n=1 Tax=Mycena albidolilacea TaxID=1033008 RepID=A0AAD6ZDY1_9AGAR|nr:hypothetical protein DFH08DRAFT_819781 [Mycena albidolilacea]